MRLFSKEEQLENAFLATDLTLIGMTIDFNKVHCKMTAFPCLFHSLESLISNKEQTAYTNLSFVATPSGFVIEVKEEHP